MTPVATSGVRLGRALRYATAILAALVFVAPLLAALNGALKGPAEIGDVLALPAQPTLDNFRIGFAQIAPNLLNSLKITVPAIVLSVFIGCLAAYPLAMMSARRGRIIYLFLLAGMFVPYQIVQIPSFYVVRALGLYNTAAGLWLVHTAFGIPVCTFFMRNYFATIPRSMHEAAQLDGCGPAGYFFKILLPASLPGLAALSIVQSRAIWNDLLFAMTLTNSDKTMPVTAMLNAYVGATQVQYGPLMAAALISVVPPILVFLLFQKAFVRGLLGGSSK